MRFLSAPLIAILVCIVACHSAPSTAPTPDAQTKSSDQVFIDTYVWALGHAEKEPRRACENFKALSANKAFLAHDLATLRAIEICGENAFPEIDRHTLPAWLQDEAVNVLLKTASAQKNLELEMELAQDKAKQRLSQAEKIKWLQLALHCADEMKRPDDAEVIKAKLYALAPRLNPEAPDKQLLSVANDYRSARQFTKAAEAYEKVLARPNSSLEEKIAALRGLRQVSKNSRKKEDHLKAAARFVRFLQAAVKSNPKNRRLLNASFEAQIYQARALWTDGQSTAAQAVVSHLEGVMRGQASRAELFWLKARMAEEAQNFDEANQDLTQALAEPYTDEDFHDKITWYTAWNARRRGDLPQSARILAQLDLGTKTDFTRQRALYWLGRTELELNRLDEADNTFRRLIEIDPLGFYGLLAHRQLKTPISIPKKQAPKIEPVEALPYNRSLVNVLAKIQERNVLAVYLDQAVANYKAKADTQSAVWVTIFKDYARAGLYMKLYEALGALSADAREEILEQNTDLVFPRPYAKEIQAAASTFNVPSELIYSIIRQESAFDPLARSGADAFGLMQLLPEVAEQLSTRYKIEYRDMEDLFIPAINVQLGGAHLKELLERQKGQFILAVASYNASENAIRGWLKSRWNKDAVEFIEDIPYEETRSYVRLVMRNFVFYKLLNSKAAQIDFPEWLLQLNKP